VVIAEVFRKTTPRTPRQVMEVCRRRLHRYDLVSRRDPEP
jgi:phage-related protein